MDSDGKVSYTLPKEKKSSQLVLEKMVRATGLWGTELSMKMFLVWDYLDMLRDED